MNLPNPDFIRTDEYYDFVDTLEFCLESLTRTKQSDAHWKWVIISLHNALQGALVCVLKGTDDFGIMNKKSAEKMYEWHEQRRKGKQTPYPKMHLANTMELLERASRSQYMSEFNGMPISLTSQQKKDFSLLNTDLRNQFTHFAPSGWSIEKEGLPRIILNMIDIIEQLMTHPSAQRFSENQMTRIQDSLSAMKAWLS